MTEPGIEVHFHTERYGTSDSRFVTVETHDGCDGWIITDRGELNITKAGEVMVTYPDGHWSKVKDMKLEETVVAEAKERDEAIRRHALDDAAAAIFEALGKYPDETARPITFSEALEAIRERSSWGHNPDDGVVCAPR